MGLYVIAARAIEAPQKVWVQNDDELRQLHNVYPWIYRCGTDQVLEIADVGLEKNVIMWRDFKETTVAKAIEDRE